jgi:hypothetical protein
MSTVAPWIADGKTEDDLKRRFAQYCYERPDTPLERMQAAKLLFPRQDQVFLALQCAQDWINDPIVIEELTRLRSSGADENLPSKADIARRYINLADDKSISVEQRIKALDRYSELMGMKPVPGALGTGAITVDNRRVFVLPQPQTLDAWESETVGQQSKLIEGNARSA